MLHATRNAYPNRKPRDNVTGRFINQIKQTTYNTMSSITNTLTQQAEATMNRFPPNQAQIMPATRAPTPAIGEFVASMIAGNVMTASVTYGT